MAKKRKILGRKHLIIISSIIALNAIGMSYAFWSDQMQIQTTLKTGNVTPAFCAEHYWINIVRDGGEPGNHPGWEDDKEGINESELSNLNIRFDENRQAMTIEGTLEEGYKAFVHYCVVNDGTIPIKYDQNEGNELLEGMLKISDGLKIHVEQQAQILEPQEKVFSDHSNGNSKLAIQVPNEPDGQSIEDTEETSTHTFELKLPFSQWTKN